MVRSLMANGTAYILLSKHTFMSDMQDRVVFYWGGGIAHTFGTSARARFFANARADRNVSF